VGERSVVKANNSIFENGNIGVEVKDDSEFTLSDSSIRGNNIGWHAYRKKWAFSVAGRGQGTRLRFRDNKVADVDLEDGGTLILTGTPKPKVLRGDIEMRAK
jgi:hypothetical protein